MQVPAAPIPRHAFTIAASDSSAKHKQQADYVCDGTEDEEQIQAAIEALGAAGSGTLLFAPGTYNCAAPVVLSGSSGGVMQVSLVGTGGLNDVKLIWADGTNCHGVTYAATATAFGQFRMSNIHLDNQNDGTYWSFYATKGHVDWEIYDCVFENCFFYGGGSSVDQSGGACYVEEDWASHWNDCTFEYSRGKGLQWDNSQNPNVCGIYVAHNDGNGAQVNSDLGNFCNSGFNDNGIQDSTHGFKLTGINVASVNHFSNCEFQANYGHGFWIASSPGALTLTGCSAYANGLALAANSAGFFIESYGTSTDCSRTLVSCIATDNDDAATTTGFRIAHPRTVLLSSQSYSNAIGVAMDAAADECVIEVDSHNDTTPISRNSGSVRCDYVSRKRSKNHTANATLTYLQSGLNATNFGAAGLITFTLPPATEGVEYTFVVRSAQLLRVDPDGTEVIYYNGTGGGAGGYLQSNDLGALMRLECVYEGRWEATTIRGLWTTESGNPITVGLGVDAVTTAYLYTATTDGVTGVWGRSTTAPGCRGLSTSNSGLYGQSTSGDGVTALSTTGRCGYFYRNSAVGTGAVVYVFQDHASEDQTALAVRQDGTGAHISLSDGTYTTTLDLDGSGNFTLTDDVTGAKTLAELAASEVDDTAYGVGWNGDTTTAPSKNAVYDKIETLGGGHDAVTLAGVYDYLTLSSQEITLGQIDLATDVTGDLPYANITAATAADKLLGRGSAGGAGDWEEITLGSGLTMTGTTLSASASAPALDEITDVTITGPVADNEVLAWNGTDTWINQTAAEAGLATSGHNHDGVYEPAGVAASDITDASANGQAILTAANYAAMRALLDLEIGTDVLAQQTIGIADNNLVEIDDLDAADNDYAKFTLNGLEGRSYAEVKTDLSLNNVENTALTTWTGSTSVVTVGTIGTGTWQGTAIADGYISSAATWNAKVDTSGTPVANDFAKFTDADTIEGRSYAETKTDLSLDNVANVDTTSATVGTIIDGGGSAITTGVKGDIRIPFAGTITKVTLLADQSGSIIIDLWKDTYANFPPTDVDSITSATPPTITTATKSEDSTLTGWTTSVTAGDIIRFNVDSDPATSITRVTINIDITRT
jgi:hypothetical protein